MEIVVLKGKYVIEPFVAVKCLLGGDSLPIKFDLTNSMP